LWTPTSSFGSFDRGETTNTVSDVTCAFCDRVAAADFVAENNLAVAFWDAFPLNPGHCLIVPRRHEADFLALTPEEQAAVWALVALVRRHIEAERTPDGYNIGVNVREAAGQTIAHAHLHVIPRYRGDVPDPRGGVRWVVPARAAYWERR
jgi:diadenosine tetraphosphate (Ap4A) HIT family hydrolase